MALTLTALENQDVFGAFKAVLCTATFDATYPPGGEDVSTPAESVGIENVRFVVVCDGCSTGGYVCSYDVANKKLKAWYGDNNNAADGPLIESATTDLSAESITVLVCGD